MSDSHVRVAISHLLAQRITDGPHETPEFLDEGVPFLSVDNVVNNELRFEGTRFVSMEAHLAYARKCLPRRDDVVVTKAASIGRVALVQTDRPFNIWSPLAVLRADTQRLLPRYLYYALLGSDAQLQMQLAASSNTQQNLAMPDLASIKVPVPTLSGQRAIADYLDAETSRIDALIEKKGRMIELLNQRFDSFVFHLVSGQHVHEDRRESALDWLGSIPKSWTVQPVSANFSVALGKMVNPEATGGEEQYPYLRNTNVKWDGFDLENLDQMHFDAADRRRCELRSGDLLVCEGGEVGRAAVWEGLPSSCYFQKAIHRVRPVRYGNTRFLMYCLRAAAGRNVFSVEGNQSTIVHLTREKLRVHRFPYPEPDIQADLVRVLDQEKGHVLGLLDRLGQQVELLGEHRQSLVTAVVTGELGIPGVAA